jgi:thiol-disulfide isomerase/thioredoxin
MNQSQSPTDPTVEPTVKVDIIDYTIERRAEFIDLLQKNPGVIIIKFHADWCKPCKRIAPHVLKLYNLMPPEIMCVNMNIDDNIDLYAYMKRMKLVRGIPVIFAYYKGNTTYIPDHSISGTDLQSINTFFSSCISKSLAQ